MGVGVAVYGASGYAGGELLRLIDAHPQLSVQALVANRQAGKRLGEVHPHLTTLADRPLEPADAVDLAAVQLVFLALPHGQSAAIAATLPEHVRVVDLGADFRLTDAAAWQRYYVGEHAGSWTYGLAELPDQRAKIEAAARVANPGCHATAITLAFAPLLASSLVSGAHPQLTAVSSSGVSGAGREPSDRLMAAEVISDLTVYKAGGAHQHIPEIQQSLERLTGVTPVISMTPVLAPMPRGILAVCGVAVDDSLTADGLRDLYDTAYGDEPFVHLLADGQWPRTSSVLGSNNVHVQVALESDTHRAVVVTAIDNLGKGAAGQALQNANLMLGIEETCGLPINGCAP